MSAIQVLNLLRFALVSQTMVDERHDQEFCFFTHLAMEGACDRCLCKGALGCPDASEGLRLPLLAAKTRDLSVELRASQARESKPVHEAMEVSMKTQEMLEAAQG